MARAPERVAVGLEVEGLCTRTQSTGTRLGINAGYFGGGGGGEGAGTGTRRGYVTASLPVPPIFDMMGACRLELE